MGAGLQAVTLAAAAIERGEADVVIGPRSAIFAPLPDLGLVVVDEEHETSFKQEEMPRYNARDLAVVRGRNENAVVVLGSATPSLETQHNAQSGRFRLLSLPRRATPQPLPNIELVDLKTYQLDPERVLTAPLAEALGGGRRATGAFVGSFTTSRIFGLAQGFGQVGFDQVQFETLLLGKVLAAGFFVLGDGVLALLDHLLEHAQHAGIVDGRTRVDLDLLDRGEHESHDLEAVFVAGLHGCLNVVLDLAFQGHRSGIPSSRCA